MALYRDTEDFLNTDNKWDKKEIVYNSKQYQELHNAV